MDHSHRYFQTMNMQLENLNNLEIKYNLQKLQFIKHLYEKGAKTNAQLCNHFHISSPTSMKLLRELLDAGLVKKQGRGESIGGRKPDLYALQDRSFFVLGIHIERYKMSMALFDNNNNRITKTKTIPLDLASDCVLDTLYDHASAVMNNADINQDKIIGIGLSLPGLVSSKEGKSFTYVMEKHNATTLQDSLEKRFEKPVLILNDAKSGCLAEFRFGLARHRSSVLVLSMDGGLGLGIIMNGKLQQGISGFAGEFGHIPFVEDGLLCHCGKRGCLETVASGIALVRKAKEGVKGDQRSMLNELSAQEINEIDPRVIINAAHKGDQFAIKLLSETGINLGKGLAILIQLLNPELIVLQGKIAEAKQYITTPIQHSINTYCMTQLRERMSIALSELGSDAILLGSVAAVMEDLFTRLIEAFKARLK